MPNLQNYILGYVYYFKFGNGYKLEGGSEFNHSINLHLVVK